MGDRGRLHVSGELAGVLEKIEEIGGLLDERADAAEELGRLPEDTARALLDTGIVRAELPLSLGGYEFAPRQLIETVERTSYHDAAAGWTMFALQMMTGTTAAYLSADASAELFPDVPNGKYALLSGHGTRPGRAVPCRAATG